MKDFWGKILFLGCSFFIIFIIFFGMFKLRNWGADEILFNDLKQISIDNNNRSFDDTVIVTSSFIYKNSIYVKDIKAKEIDFDDAYNNVNDYIGDFIQFNGVLIEHIGTNVYNKFDIKECRFITNKGMEVIVYSINDSLPELKSYVLVKGTIIGKNYINGKKIIEFVGIIQ